MATAIGFSGNDIQFVVEPTDELKCAICQFVLREPVQIMSCGHRFCAHCFNQMRDHAEETNVDLQCPVDREPVDLAQVFPDKAAARTIGNLQVYCENSERGCRWVGDLRDVQSHSQNCEFSAVRAPNVATSSNRRDSELESTLERIVSRLESCENDLVMKNKDLANLRFTVLELVEDKKQKCEEIRKLRKEVNESTNYIRKELNNAKKVQDQSDVEVLMSSQMLQNQITNIEYEMNCMKDMYASQNDLTELKDAMKDMYASQNDLTELKDAVKELKDDDSVDIRINVIKEAMNEVVNINEVVKDLQENITNVENELKSYNELEEKITLNEKEIQDSKELKERINDIEKEIEELSKYSYKLEEKFDQ